MLTKFRPKTTLLVIGLLAALLYAWLQLAPTALGGKVSYLVVEGQSMEPVFTAGDLVLARSADDYDVGDIIAYRSDLLDVTVMHRVIERGPGIFTTQGDNNPWIDEYQPTRDDVLGVPFTHIPKAGTYLIWASRPINAALLLCVGSLISFGGLFVIRKRRRMRGPDGARRKAEPTGPLSELRIFLRSQRMFLSSLRSSASEEENTGPESTRAPPGTSDRKNRFEMLLIGLVAGLVPILLLGAFALTQPKTQSETTRSIYQQSSEFAYSANVSPDPVYIEPPLMTGEPIFRRLVDSFDVYFDYEFSAVVPHFMSGTGQLVMEVSEESGWKRAFALGPETEFDGNELRLGAQSTWRCSIN